MFPVAEGGKVMLWDFWFGVHAMGSWVAGFQAVKGTDFGGHLLLEPSEHLNRDFCAAKFFLTTQDPE